MYTEASLSPEARGLCELQSWCCTWCGFGQRNKNVYLPVAVSFSFFLFLFIFFPIAVSKSRSTILNKHSLCSPSILPLPPLHTCWYMHMRVHVETKGPPPSHSSGAIHLVLFICLFETGSFICLEPANSPRGLGLAGEPSGSARSASPFQSSATTSRYSFVGWGIWYAGPSVCKTSILPTELSPEPTTEVFLSLYHSFASFWNTMELGLDSL